MRSVSTRFVGLLLVALGVWGGLVPFVGHYFHFALGPDKSWDWTTGRLWLDVLPGAVTVLGGLNLMSAGPRHSARLGALLAIAGGIWFTIGPEISTLWKAGGDVGAAHGSAHIQMLEMLTYHTGLGVIVAALGAFALPRFPLVDEVAAPGHGRVAAAGAGAGAGAVAARRGDRWYDEPGALDAPASERERVAARDAQREPVAGDTATHRHHLGEDAAVGAAGAGVGAAAEAHHERRVEREEAQREGADETVAEEAGRGRQHLGRDAAVGAAGAGVGAAAAAHHERRVEREEAQREGAGDPVADGTRGETVADREAGAPGETTADREAGAPGETVADREAGAPGATVADGQPATAADGQAATAADARTATAGEAAPTAGTADTPGAAGEAPADASEQPTTVGSSGSSTTPTRDYADHTSGRRRRGGLLSSLLRR